MEEVASSCVGRDGDVRLGLLVCDGDAIAVCVVIALFGYGCEAFDLIQECDGLGR